MPSLELVYNLPNLDATGWNVRAVLLALGLLEDELGDMCDLLVAESPYIEYRVFFINSHMDPRPEYLYTDSTNWITRQLLSTNDVGCAFTTLARYTAETPNAIQRIEDVGVHAEFEI